MSENLPRVGTFVKTGSPHIIENLGLTRLDFVVIDAEHGPFDRAHLDLMLMAARSSRLQHYVRVADHGATQIGASLDLGADGVVVPHVDSAAEMTDVVAKTRFLGGRRGFSSTPRFAEYGTLGMASALAQAERTEVIAQIETPAAVAAAAEIAAVAGTTGLFVGRADLAVAMGFTSTAAPQVLEAALHVIAVARQAGVLAGVAVGDVGERDFFAAKGANWFVIGSDQSLLRKAADAVAWSNRESDPSASMGETPVID